MKLSEYAKQKKIHYKTALDWWHKGYLNGEQVPSGTILIDDNNPLKSRKDVVFLKGNVKSEREES